MQAIRSAIGRIIYPFECAFTTPIVTTEGAVRKTLPSLPPELWLEIFQFATYIHKTRHLAPLDPFNSVRPSNNVMGANTPFLAQRTKASLVLVCQFWHEIATPLLYEHIVITSPPRADSILRALEKHVSTSALGRVSEYGLCVRNLEVLTHARNAHTVAYLLTLFRIFLLCPRLRILSGTWKHALPKDFVRGIMRQYGASLQELYWEDSKDNSFMSAVHLSSFHSIRVLDLQNYSGIDASTTTDLVSLERQTLPLLEHLVLTSSHASMCAALTLSLPSLHTLTLKVNGGGYLTSKDILKRFLSMHGPVLTSVHLPRASPSTSHSGGVNPDIFLAPSACPNLHTLTYTVHAPVLTMDKPHPTLRRIGIYDIGSTGLYPDKYSTTKAHLMALKRNLFPRLETVRTLGFCVESDSDMLVEDVFIWWTEHFELDGVDFQDGAGVVWVYEEP